MSAPLSAVLVTPSWPPERAQNGIVSYVAALIPELAQFGVVPRLLPMHVESEYSGSAHAQGMVVASQQQSTWLHYFMNRLRHLRSPRRAGSQHHAWQVLRAIECLHRREPIDLCEAEETCGFAHYLADRAHKLVIRLHGPWFLVGPALGFPADGEMQHRCLWEGRVIAKAHAVSSPSRFALQAVRSHYGLALANAVVIPNATPEVPEQGRWSIEKAVPRSLLFVGRFDHIKGADLVIEAFARLHKKDPSTTLTIVGPDYGIRNTAGGTHFFADYVDKHVPAAARSSLHYLGSQPPRTIASLRTKAAVTIVASRFETLSMTALEAMAAGAPVVGARAGGLTEVLEFGGDELRFRTGDAEDLAQRVSDLFDRPQRAAELGELGRRECERRYSPQIVARATADFYRSVCAGN